MLFNLVRLKNDMLESMEKVLKFNHSAIMVMTARGGPASYVGAY